MQKIFRYFPTKEIFDNTPKAYDSNNNSYFNGETVIQDEPEIKWQDICFIEKWDNTSYISPSKIYTHGAYYGCVDDAISLSYAYTNNVHGIADALDVAKTIDDKTFVISSHINEITSNIDDISFVVASQINEIFDRLTNTEKSLNDTTLAEAVPNEIIKALWDGDIKFEDLMGVTGSADIEVIDSNTNHEHFLEIFYPEEEENNDE